MEDCCVVCAEPLEWIGYGPCGHREVCFTCVARLRFVLNDKNCCICKQECPTVYVTKALGDYTRVVTDWAPLVNHSNSLRKGNLWYDNAVEAYFDDEEPLKIIRAMCRLSCSICERVGEDDSEPVTKGVVRKGYTFRNIDALWRHHSFVHKLSMCELCLEGRKVFVSEQKLYSKSQMRLHYRKGAPAVDGIEGERGGFAGHPMCNFCQKPFYGDNELYQHMSQDHFTCHICQRARPGHFEYYRNYDDLEAHFRQGHSLCEHPECLARKFVVFPSVLELKRHNATTHGGHMTRAQKNAALRVPVTIHHRQEDGSRTYSSRQGGGGSRGEHSHAGNASNDEPSEAVLGSVDVSADLDNAVRERLHISPGRDESRARDSQGAVQSGVRDSQGAVERLIADPVEGTTSQPEGDADIRPSRYLAAVGGGARSSALGGARSSALGDVAFPPLPVASQIASRQPDRRNQGPASIMAALLNGNRSGRNARAGIRVLNAADFRKSSLPT